MDRAYYLSKSIFFQSISVHPWTGLTISMEGYKIHWISMDSPWTGGHININISKKFFGYLWSYLLYLSEGLFKPWVMFTLLRNTIIEKNDKQCY